MLVKERKKKEPRRKEEKRRKKRKKKANLELHNLIFGFAWSSKVSL